MSAQEDGVVLAEESRQHVGHDRGPTIIASNASITAIAALVVIVRVAPRLSTLKRIGLDDWTILAAALLAIANLIIATQSVRHGLGRHIAEVPLKNLVPANIFLFLNRIFYFLDSGTVKLSVCFLYLRLFPNLRRPILLLVAVNVSATIAQTFSIILECVPLAAIWDRVKYPDAKCIDVLAFQSAAASISVATDIWALILPIPTILSLQIHKRIKCALIAMLSMGVLACVAGIVRMAFLVKLLESKDPTWDTVGMTIASGWETGLAIITASIPALKPGFGRIFPRGFSSTGIRSAEKEYEMPATRGLKPSRLTYVSVGTIIDQRSESATKMAGVGEGEIKIDIEYVVKSEARVEAENSGDDVVPWDSRRMPASPATGF